MDERIKAYETKMSKSYDSLLKEFQYDPRRPCQSPCTGQDHRGLLRNTDPAYSRWETSPFRKLGCCMIQPWEKKPDQVRSRKPS